MSDSFKNAERAAREIYEFLFVFNFPSQNMRGELNGWWLSLSLAHEMAQKLF